VASLFEAFKSPITSALMLGGGSYQLPKDFYDTYGADVDVVEIDPAVTDVAERFFNLSAYPIQTVHTDGRLYVRGTNKTYDVILNDAFASSFAMPWHLTTEEFHQLIQARLNPNGLYIVNVISSQEGDSAQFFGNFLKTVARVFPNYHVIALGDTPASPQNIFIVGIHGDQQPDADMLRERLATLIAETNLRLNPIVEHQPPLSLDAMVLRDDFAPVERLTASLVNAYIQPYAEWFYSVTNR